MVRILHLSVTPIWNHVVRNLQHAILAEYRKQGLHPAKVTKAQRDEIVRGIMTVRERVVGAGKAALSVAATSVGIYLVPEEVFEARQAQCRTNECRSYQLLADGAEACNRCGCSGIPLIAKLHDRRYECPARNPKTKRPYWERWKPTDLTVSAPGVKGN